MERLFDSAHTPYRVSRPLGVLVLIALVVAFWSFRIVLPGSERPGFGDILFYYYPLYEIAYGQLGEDFLTLWNPYELCGVPWLATLQGGFFYPPHLLYVLLPTHVALAVSSLLHLAFIALSMAALARRAGLSDFAALLAAALGVLSGHYSSMLLAPNTLEAASWLPLGALAVLGLAQGGGSRFAALLSLCMGASLLAGYPQSTVYCVYAWTALLAILLLGDRRPISERARIAAVFAGALAIGTLIAGIQLLPSFELAAEATRSLESLSPERMFPFAAQATTLLPSHWGLVGAALLPATLLARRHRALAFGALALCALTLLFSLGSRTRSFDVYLSLPLLGSFRQPSRILFVTDFFFALAAAIGFDAAIRAPTPRGFSVERNPAASGDTHRESWLREWAPAMLVVGCGLAVATARGFDTSAVVTLLALSLALMTLAVGARTPQRAHEIAVAAAAMVLAIAVAESFTAKREQWELPYLADSYPAVHRDEHPEFRAIAASGDRVLLLGRGRHPSIAPKLGTLHRMKAVNGYEPMNLRRQAEYFTYLMQGTADATSTRHPFSGRLFRRNTDEKEVNERSRLLDLAAVRFVLATHRPHDPALRSYLAGAGLVRRSRFARDIVLFENPDALPRAFVTYRARPAPPPAELLALMSRDDFDPLAMSYLEGRLGWTPAPDAPERGEPASIVVDEARVVEIEASLKVPGLVVLADSYYPGWRATVDGEPAEILAANHLFRGVPVSEGRHTVRFEYRPRSIRVGLACSIAGLLALALLWRVNPTARASGGRPGAGPGRSHV